MKYALVSALVLASTFALAAAHAGEKFDTTPIKCTNGEEINLRLTTVGTALYKADVTVQSVGDSYPTYHFKNVKLQIQSHVFGAPAVYKNADFELDLVAGKTLEGTLNIPSVGIKYAKLTCK
jgi:hypothetical protein